MKSKFDEIENKIHAYEISEYGNIAKYRRGLINISEAEELWNYAEYRVDLLLSVANDPQLSKIVSINFEATA